MWGWGWGWGQVQWNRLTPIPAAVQAPGCCPAVAGQEGRLSAQTSFFFFVFLIFCEVLTGFCVFPPQGRSHTTATGRAAAGSSHARTS